MPAKRRTARQDRTEADDAPPLARALAPSQPDSALPLWLLGGFALLMLLALIVLWTAGAMRSGHELTFDRAVFTVVNVATLTGFQTNVGVGQSDAANALVPGVVLLLTLAGTLLSLVVGGLAVVRILRLPYTDDQVVTSALVTTLVATLAGTAALIGSVPSLYDAVLLSLSAFGNSGVHLRGLPRTTAWPAHLVLMPLAVTGGLGLTVLMELYDRAIRGRPLSTHARTVLWLMAGLYVGGAAAALFSRPEFWNDLLGGLTGGGWTVAQGNRLRDGLVSSGLLSLNARSAGFPFEYAGALPRTTQWIVLLLMAVGASPAGTAGGLKGTTLLLLARGVRDALAGRRVGRAFGIAATWLGAYLLIVALCFSCLLWQQPELPTDQLLFLGVSAAGNVGLSHDLLSIVGPGLFTLSLTMLLGRLAPLAILWWMARTTADADVAVG